MAKKLKAVITRAGKNAEAIIKQIATQELQVQKFRIEKWKQQKVIFEVECELQVIRIVYEKVMEVQKQAFPASTGQSEGEIGVG